MRHPDDRLMLPTPVDPPLRAHWTSPGPWTALGPQLRARRHTIARATKSEEWAQRGQRPRALVIPGS